jgi:hypothetical protein
LLRGDRNLEIPVQIRSLTILGAASGIQYNSSQLKCKYQKKHSLR